MASVWAGRHGGNDRVYDTLPPSLWISEGTVRCEKGLLFVDNFVQYYKTTFIVKAKKGFVLGQAGGLFPVQNGQHKQENTRGLWLSFLQFLQFLEQEIDILPTKYQQQSLINNIAKVISAHYLHLLRADSFF